MESSTARMDNHRTDHHVLHLSICLELIRTITIQSIPFNTRFFIFFIQNKVIRYTSALIAIPFLYLLLPENCLLFIVSVWNCFRTNFLQTKRLPYVTGYKSGTCCRMASVMAKLCFFTPRSISCTHSLILNMECDIFTYTMPCSLIPLCSAFLSGRKENRYISIAFPLLLIAFSCYSIYSSPNREREKRLAVQRYAERTTMGSGTTNDPYQ